MSLVSLGRMLITVSTGLLFTPSVHSAGPASQELIGAQRKAMEVLSFLDGHWRGEARIPQPDGSVLTLVQTERVGPFLDGALRLIEGRGYTPDGALAFNAFAVVSYSPQTGKYNFRSYAQGFSGDFPMEVRPDGFTWTANAGGATLRYTATISGDTWTEIGERIVPGRPPVRTIEMSLRRIGASDWPASGAVLPADPAHAP